MSRPTALVALLLALVVALPAFAVEPDERLEDPALEARARGLSQNIRCLVCQNESIDSSNADLAKELRILVRERLLAGDSDEEVEAYLVSRYGDYVLLEPPVKSTTYLLWFGPIILLSIGVLAVLLYFRRQRVAAPAGARAAQRVGAGAPGTRLLEAEDAADSEPRTKA